jgi:hypothetical protein
MEILLKNHLDFWESTHSLFFLRLSPWFLVESTLDFILITKICLVYGFEFQNL